MEALWAERTGEAHAGRSRWRNAALLIGGYIAGQGAIFAIQTVLLAQEQLHLLATFGLAFSFAILGSLIVDFGALTVLARETAHAGGEPQQVWGRYWSITACRLVIGVAVAGLAGGYALLADDAFSGAYAAWALPAALLWSFNAAGILDGLRLSGVNGLTGSAPYLSSALALAGVVDAAPAVSGSVLGGALTAGYALTLIGQCVALSRAGRPPRFVRPTARDVVAMGRDGWAVLLGTLPGQLYLRYQLFLASAVLGPAGTALFLYAKQVSTACAQVIGFLRRAEFPDLVVRLATVRGDLARTVLDAQRAGTLLGVAGAVALVLGGTAGTLWLAGSLGDAATATAMFGPVVLAGALSAAFMQGLQATGRYAVAAAVVVVSVGAGAAISAVALIWPALAVFAVADAVVYVVALALSRAALLGPRRLAGERGG